MWYSVILVLHVIVCVALIGIVLIQAGRGGGLAESFSGAESVFGTKTSAFLTRATTIFAVLFFFTCLSLAFVSKQHSKSLLKGKKAAVPEQQKVDTKTEPGTSRETKPAEEKAQTQGSPAQAALPQTPPSEQTAPVPAPAESSPAAQ